MTVTSAPTRAVLLAVALAALFVFLSTLLLLHIEPPFGELLRGQPDQVNVLGSGIVFGALALAIAFIVDQLPCWRGTPNCD